MKTTLENLAIFTLATLIASVTTLAALGSNPFAPNNAPMHATTTETIK
jgi:hypothetical protein